jgi:transposase-like protein
VKPRRVDSGERSPISCENASPKIGALMDKSEADVLAHLSFPKAHRLQIHSTNPPFVPM